MVAKREHMPGIFAVREYQQLQLPITVSIIQHRLDDLLAFSKAALLRDGRG